MDRRTAMSESNAGSAAMAAAFDVNLAYTQPMDAAAAAASSSSAAPAPASPHAHSSFSPDDGSSASSHGRQQSASSSSSSIGAGGSGGAHGHPQLVALRKIDALSEKLQKEGKLLEALQCMEKSLILRGHIFGLDSVEVFRACKSVGEMANFLAMTFLQQDLFDVTLELLKKAEVLSERHRAVRAVTFNNLACYYRKRGKLRTALNYCRKALGIEAKLAEAAAAAAATGGAGPVDAGGDSVVAVKSADTHLNMCTILSELKRHEKAIVHARIALKLLLIELFGDFDQLQRQEQQERQQQQQQQQMDDSSAASASHEQIATGSHPASRSHPASMERLRARLPADRVAVLAIAYHNLAVQQEFLRKYDDSLSSYEKATRVVSTHLGAAHPLCASLAESYAAAQAKMDNKARRQKEHSAARAGGKSMTSASASASASTAKLDSPANRSTKLMMMAQQTQLSQRKQQQQQQQQHQQQQQQQAQEQEQQQAQAQQQYLQEEEDAAYTDDGEYNEPEEEAAQEDNYDDEQTQTTAHA